MKFKDFVIGEGYNESSFRDSGVIDLFSELVEKYLTTPVSQCPKCDSMYSFLIEPGNKLRCMKCNVVFNSKRSPEQS